jgi:hypothetical protein
MIASAVRVLFALAIVAMVVFVSSRAATAQAEGYRDAAVPVPAPAEPNWPGVIRAYREVVGHVPSATELLDGAAMSDADLRATLVERALLFPSAGHTSLAFATVREATANAHKPPAWTRDPLLLPQKVDDSSPDDHQRDDDSSPDDSSSINSGRATISSAMSSSS